ncbi:hypothetical protein QBC35DRAFT_108460 [Podospora australis]|uniref:Zn(2)-C6 fungal-type domain-containing protein n=1 Tax=Podospora australis TaxID=1536484 RepID=A0AAN7AND8_9PEZI|nr:hypothetical protein QBC35DRAFT_108460 [Podospora australis]
MSKVMSPLFDSGVFNTQTWSFQCEYQPTIISKPIKPKPSAMSAEQPAGYFSTFSILDPNRNNPEGPGKPQKRNRRVYVCIPCHRRKLKCDKGQPCSRCIQADAADECVYQKFPFGSKQDAGSESGDTPRTPGRASPRVTPVPTGGGGEGKARLHGMTHWNNIAFEFREGFPYTTGTDPSWGPRYRHIQSLKYLVATLPNHNFPFGEICNCSGSREHALRSLPPRELVETLLRSYFEAVEPIYRLCHPQQFQYELELLWIDNSQCSEEWLAQFFMMLALGCQAVPAHILSGTGRRSDDWTEQFLTSAQYFFGRSPLVTAPTLATIRTLCLAVVARMMEIVRGGEVSHLLSLVGYLSKTAISMHLHRTSLLFPDLTPFEIEMRRRLWVTVQMLELEVAMRTGTSQIFQDYDTEPPSYVNNSNIYRTEHGWMMDNTQAAASTRTDGTFQAKMAEVLPTMSEIINTVNSTSKTALKYDKVQTWDEELRRKLRETESILSPQSQSHPVDRGTTTLQLDFFKIWTKRTLLALHHHYASIPRFQQYPASCKAVITASLELLDIQLRWRKQSLANAEYPILVSSSSSKTPTAPTGCLLNICRDDFGAAMLYLIAASRRISLGSIQVADEPRSQPEALSALIHQNLDDFRDRACKSTAHFMEFITLFVAAGCLQSLNSERTMMAVLTEVADQIEHTILSGKLWAGGGGSFMEPGTVAAGFHHPIEPFAFDPTGQ